MVNEKKHPCGQFLTTPLRISLYWLVSRRPVELRKFCVVELHKPNIRRAANTAGACHDIVGWQLLLAAVSQLLSLGAHTHTHTNARTQRDYVCVAVLFLNDSSGRAAVSCYCYCDWCDRRRPTRNALKRDKDRPNGQ